MSARKFSMAGTCGSMAGHGGSDPAGVVPDRSARAEALTYRQFFALRWSRFIRTNFESAEHAAHVFGVDGSTAKKWWEGSHAPSGFAVGYAYARFGVEATQPLRGAA